MFFAGSSLTPFLEAIARANETVMVGVGRGCKEELALKDDRGEDYDKLKKGRMHLDTVSASRDGGPTTARVISHRCS